MEQSMKCPKCDRELTKENIVTYVSASTDIDLPIHHCCSTCWKWRELKIIRVNKDDSDKYAEAILKYPGVAFSEGDFDDDGKLTITAKERAERTAEVIEDSPTNKKRKTNAKKVYL